MSPWILLLFTLISAFVTYDTFRWSGSLKDAPPNIIASMWKGGLNHLPLSQQNKIKNYYATSIFGAIQFQLIFLAVTISLAFATVMAFLE